MEDSPNDLPSGAPSLDSSDSDSDLPKLRYFPQNEDQQVLNGFWGL